jgi:hypothetical protein
MYRTQSGLLCWDKQLHFSIPLYTVPEVALFLLLLRLLRIHQSAAITRITNGQAAASDMMKPRNIFQPVEKALIKSLKKITGSALNGRVS